MNLSSRISRRKFLAGAGAMAVFGPPLLFPDSRPAGAEPHGPGVRLDRYYHTMGSIASVTLYGPDREFCMSAAAEAFAAMQLVDRHMSSYRADSALNMVNRDAGRDAVRVPTGLLRVVGRAGGIWRATSGAFDVTVGPLLELYGFFSGERSGRLPSDRQIARTLETVGFRNVKIDPSAGTLGLTRAGARLDLGGIAVGYALDLAGAALRARGVRNALINHSGDILALGAPPAKPGWEIGIQDPTDPRGTIGKITLRDASISTSGNYENCITLDNRVIGHILDPLRGGPVSRYSSISVIAGSSLDADALATGIFAGGPGVLTCGDEALENVSVYAVSGGPEGPVGGFLVDRLGVGN